jgi:Holliday junction resolvase-like predicted endonuclease
MEQRPPGMHRTAAQQAGDTAEQRAAAHLVGMGWTVLGRNVRVGRGELDLVAIDPGRPPTLVIVEVRWRRDRGFGLPEETVDGRKRRRVRHAAYGLLSRGCLADGTALPDLPVRFDLVCVEPGSGRERWTVRHHRAAL